MAASAQVNLAPGMRMLCRDAEWLVTKVENADKSFRYRGHGSQRRFQLKVPFDAAEHARAQSGGEFSKFLELVGSVTKRR